MKTKEEIEAEIDAIEHYLKQQKHEFLKEQAKFQLKALKWVLNND